MSWDWLSIDKTVPYERFRALNNDRMRLLGQAVRARQSNLRILNVREDFGAKGDGVADDTVAIQAAANEMEAGSVLYFPPIERPASDPNFKSYRISGAIALPHKEGITIAGAGGSSSIVRQVTSGQNVFEMLGTNWANAVNYVTFAGLRAWGASLAPYGFKLRNILNLRMLDVFAYNCTTAGIDTEDVQVADLERVILIGNGDGFHTSNSANSALNALNCFKCIATSNTGHGFNLGWGSTAVTILGGAIQANVGGGIYSSVSMVGLDVLGVYFEGNTNGVAASQDIYIGAGNVNHGGIIQGNTFYGRLNGQTYDYVPVRIGNANGLVMRGNSLTQGTRLVSFDAAPLVGVDNSCFENTAIATVHGTPSTYYLNAPSWSTRGNSVREPRMGLIGPTVLDGGLATYGAADSAGAGYRQVRVPN